MTKTISLLGATGSIGRQTLAVAQELGLSVAALTARGWTAEVTQASVSRTRPAGRLHLLTANNPIFLITGTRK